jgi:hypothetical protein
MTDSASQAMSVITTNVITFVVLMLIAYIAIWGIVYKTRLFGRLGKNGKEMLSKLTTVIVFSFLGYGVFVVNFTT